MISDDAVWVHWPLSFQLEKSEVVVHTGGIQIWLTVSHDYFFNFKFVGD